jgi:hypothetical protein
MNHHQRLQEPRRTVRALTCTAILATAGLTLAACGGSSGSSTAASPQRPRTRAALTACLKKQGVTVPQRSAGNRPPGGGRGGGGLGLGPGGPPGAAGGAGSGSNADRAKRQAAFRKCGINFRGGAGQFRNSPAARQAYVKFAACVRKNGYNLPAPNTSGNGPVFNRSQVNQNNPKFIAASRKCQNLLPRRPNPAPGTNQPPGTNQ